jgi:hypothetical protein
MYQADFLVRDIAVADLPLTSLIAQNQAFIAWCAIALRLGRRRQGIFLLPFLAAQNPGYEHVGQALRFCLSDLVIIKAVPARTRTARLLKLLSPGFDSSIGHPLQLVEPFSKIRRLQCLDIGFY